MNLAAQRNETAVEISNSGSPSAINIGSLTVRVLLALGLMAIAANCFLKYLWWAAKSSALAGIPKVAAEWRAAGARVSLFGWSFLLLEIASVFVFFSLIRFRSVQTSKLRNALRCISSLIVTTVGTTLLALVLSWIKQAP